jgi:hypothetical protein
MQLAVWNSANTKFFGCMASESEENERTTVVIENNTFGSILYRQVAGALARRIVKLCWRSADCPGTDAGFIKFGSRVDLFLLSELQSTSCLIKAVGGKRLLLQSIMIEKELDIRFRKLLRLLWWLKLLCPKMYSYVYIPATNRLQNQDKH